MCAAKSPISMLQELTMIKHLPFPQYDISSQETGFKCIGIVGQISVSAVAESKKRAKHLCAERILQLLESEVDCNNLTVIVNHVGQDPIIHSKLQNPIVHIQHEVHVKAEEPNFNAIGKLNELCSQNGTPYPIYAELGVVQQKFVIQCKLLSHTTQGQASTKKQAKQIAAKEMLNSLSLRDFALDMDNLKEHSKHKRPRNVEVEEKIAELFKQLSTKSKTQRPDDSYLFPPPKAEEVKPTIEQKVEKVIEVSEDELREELRQLGVLYKIFELQRKPLVLVLQTSPTPVHPRYTFMHAADTYKLTVVGLLKKAVRDMNLINK